jgi:hypothetical protein
MIQEQNGEKLRCTTQALEVGWINSTISFLEECKSPHIQLTTRNSSGNSQDPFQENKSKSYVVEQ